ncbi:hypothetical protein ACJX0J_004749, partial [Zea mays]
MELRFPRFSQGLAQDPTTVVFGLERLYQNIFNNLSMTSGNLFHDPLHVRPIAHAIWDPHFGQPACAAGPVNIAYSGVYQWWYTIGLRTNEDLYTGALFYLFLSTLSLIGGWLLTTQMEAKPF